MNLSDFTITRIASRKVEMQSRPNGEFCALYKVAHKKTGLEGHIRYVYEWEKRDIVFEELYTDNPDLFDSQKLNESPSCFLDIHQDDVGPEPMKSELWDKCEFELFGEES